MISPWPVGSEGRHHAVLPGTSVDGPLLWFVLWEAIIIQQHHRTGDQFRPEEFQGGDFGGGTVHVDMQICDAFRFHLIERSRDSPLNDLHVLPRAEVLTNRFHIRDVLPRWTILRLFSAAPDARSSSFSSSSARPLNVSSR